MNSLNDMTTSPNNSEVAYINGEFIQSTEAKISIFDRGFLFADGVYEVISVIGGKLIDAAPHFERLNNSLTAIQIQWPEERASLEKHLMELVQKNKLDEGCVYFQVTRGASLTRTFNFPSPSVPSSIIAFTQTLTIVDRPELKTGLCAISVPDIRWARRDIKSIALLPQCLGKQAASEAGVHEAIMVEDGIITEGASSTFYIVKNKVLITRSLSSKVLPGVTRVAALKLAEEQNIKIEERAISLEEAYAADEACITAATNLIMPITRLDDKPIGSGKPGPIILRLRELYLKFAGESTS